MDVLAGFEERWADHFHQEYGPWVPAANRNVYFVRCLENSDWNNWRTWSGRNNLGVTNESGIAKQRLDTSSEGNQRVPCNKETGFYFTGEDTNVPIYDYFAAEARIMITFEHGSDYCKSEGCQDKTVYHTLF